jgi:rhodanese-related sulfurtransferase/CDGSH-type Zn-finger protein
LNRRDELFILDVREPHEYQICSLKGHLIPRGESPRRMHELHSSHEIVALCRSGRRSAQAVEFLWKAGFRKVLSLRGGMLSWPTEVRPHIAEVLRETPSIRISRILSAASLSFPAGLVILIATLFSVCSTEDFMAGTKLTVFNNGPLRVEGDFELVDQEGNAFGLSGRSSVTLCRCGLSGNSPFCDGTHKRQGFTSSVAARDLPPAAPKL